MIGRFYSKKSHCVQYTRWLLAVPLLVAAGCGGRSNNNDQAAVRNTIKQDVEAGRQQEVKSAVGKGIKLSGGDGKGNPLWKIEAKSANYAAGGFEEASKKATLVGAEAELYRNGKIESSFQASQIVMERDSKGVRFTMSGKVHAYTTNPRTGKRGPVSLNASHAVVDVNKRRVSAKQGATMTQGTGAGKVEVSAREVEADTALHTAVLRQDVKASTAATTVTAGNATWNWDTGRARASGGVKAEHDGTTIHGELLDADTEAKRGELRGGVRAVTAEGTATAGLVRFDWAGNKLVASGDVTLEKDGGTLRASRIATDAKLNHAVAEGGVTLQKDGTTLRAARAQAFDRLTRASATGGVTLTRGEIIMRADQLQAASLNDDGRARLTATGKVRLSQPGLVVTAGRAEATGLGKQGAGRVVASGGVRFAKEGKTMSAARVEATNLASKESARVTATGGVRFSGPGIAVNAGRVETANFGGELPAQFVASNGVVARAQNATIRAARVQRDNGRIVATGNVTLSRDGSTLSGRRLESNDDFRTASLSGDVQARTADGGVVKAGMLRWQNAGGVNNPERGRIQASDGVNLRQEGITLRGDRLDAPANGTAAVLTGNVVVTTSEGATLRARTARYDKKTNKVFASGGVSFKDAHQAFQTSILIYDRNTQTASTSAGSGTIKGATLKGMKLFGN